MNPENRRYGMDLAGLICAYRFRPADGICSAMTAQEVQLWLADRDRRAAMTDQTPEFIWVHVNLAHAGTEKWLQRNLDLSEVFYESLHEGTKSTRIDYADDTLIGVVNDVLFDFSYDASDIATLWLSASADIVVSARTKPLRSVDKLREAVKRGEIYRSPVDLLIHLLRDEADVLINLVRTLASRIDSIEDRLLTNRLEQDRGMLGAHRRLLIRLQRLLAPEPAALFRLLNRPPVWMAESDVLDLRQSTEEFSTVLSDMSALQERIKLLQEEIAAQINEQTNKSLFVLTTVSVMALPINIIAGLFGMNVGGIPLSQDGSGFWLIVAMVATFTIVAAMLVFRKRNEET